MSKRVQESNLKEGSAVAKPKPMNLNLLEHQENSIAREIRTARRIKVWTRVVSQPAVGNSLRGPLTMDRQCILKRGNKTMLKPQTPGNRGEETNLQLNPQLETVCERERSIPSEGGS